MMKVVNEKRMLACLQTHAHRHMQAYIVQRVFKCNHG